MALFGDEPRFYPVLCEGNVQFGYISQKEKTLDHVGPGSHTSIELENKRSGWTPKNGGLREPMSPSGYKKLTRSDHYINGDVLANGLLVPRSPDKMHYPSPGQYSPSNTESYMNRMNSTLKKSLSLPSGSVRSQSAGRPYSPRMTPPHSVLRDGVLVQCSQINETVTGPGFYFHNEVKSLNKKSFNTRSNNGNRQGVMAANDYASNGFPRSASASPRKKFNGMRPRSTNSNKNNMHISDSNRSREVTSRILSNYT